MAQQINLCNPVLLAPRRHFSARRMAQALAVLALGLLLLCAWTAWSTAQLRASLASASAFHAAERKGLQARLGSPVGDGAALQQELVQAQQRLAERQALLQTLQQGLAGAGQGPVATLTLLARTLPPTAWLADIRLHGGRLALTGHSLQPDTLPPWLDRLAADPALQGQRPALRQVLRNPADGTPGWRFQAATAAPAAASGAQP